MLARDLCCVLAVAAPLLLASCSEDDGLRTISVAVGAEVTVTFSEGACDQGPLTACLSEFPWELEGAELSVSEPFELTESRLEGGSILVTVRAVREGFTTLSVSHTDPRGRVTQDRVKLFAAEISDVVAHVHCDDDTVQPSRYPVTPGSELSVELTPMWGSTPLAAGDLELVDDAAGFVKVDPGFDGLPRYRAPSSPGKYTWDLKGSRGLDFTVYDPADVAVQLSEENGGVRVKRVLDDVPVCHHEGVARATFEVTKGACLPFVHGYEIEGPLPVDMGLGDLRLELSGKDMCEVTATLDNGGKVSLSLPVDDVPEAAGPGFGTTLTMSPLSVGGVPEKRDACPIVTNLGDGVCQVVDGDGHIVLDVECLLDWSWVKEPYSIEPYGSEVPLTKERVGQGLWIELRLGIEYSFALIPAGTYSPNHLTFSADPAMGLTIKNEGCIGHDRQVLVLQPDAAGKYTLHLDADNVYEPSTFALSAAAIDAWLLRTDEGDMKTSAAGSEAWWFVGADTRHEVRYLDAGGVDLAGAAPVRFQSDTAGTNAALAGSRIEMGNVPGDLRVETAGPGAHVIHVVDGAGIAGLGGMSAASVSVGEGQCLEAYPTEAGGERIHGKSPVRPRAKLAGAALVVDAQFPYEQKLCVRGYQPGATDISVTWGNESGQAAYTVK